MSTPSNSTRRRLSPSDYVKALRNVGRRRREVSEDFEAMTILEHLEDFRIRIFKVGIALIITTIISFIYAEDLINILALPIGGSNALVSIEITENISVFMRVSLLGGISLGLPLIIYQIVSFIGPGLKRRERRWLYFLIPTGTIFFLTGVAFAWFVMIPTGVTFLLSFMSITTDPRPMNYINFVTSILFWLGISFEMPLVIFFMAKLKWVTAKQLLSGWRYALMIIAVMAATITPTVDPVNMGLVMLPLMGLYLISVFLAWIA